MCSITVFISVFYHQQCQKYRQRFAKDQDCTDKTQFMGPAMTFKGR